MNHQIINTRLEAIKFAADRNFHFIKARANTLFYECGQVTFEINHDWCAYYVKSHQRRTPKIERLIWGCRW